MQPKYLIFRNNKGSIALLSALMIAVLGALTLSFLSRQSPLHAVIELEEKLEIESLKNKLTLALFSENDCANIFTSAPLDSYIYNDGDTGTVAMDISSSGISAYGQSIVKQGDLTSRGKVTGLWIENYLLGSETNTYNSYQALLKIKTSANTGGATLTESIPINLIVNKVSKKVSYCYLNNSVAIATCHSTGGVFDPTASPACRYSFTNRICPLNSFVSSIANDGSLKCTKSAASPPTPPPSPSLPFCLTSTDPMNAGGVTSAGQCQQASPVGVFCMTVGLDGVTYDDIGATGAHTMSYYTKIVSRSWTGTYWSCKDFIYKSKNLITGVWTFY